MIQPRRKPGSFSAKSHFMPASSNDDRSKDDLDPLCEMPQPAIAGKTIHKIIQGKVFTRGMRRR